MRKARLLVSGAIALGAVILGAASASAAVVSDRDSKEHISPID